MLTNAVEIFSSHEGDSSVSGGKAKVYTSPSLGKNTFFASKPEIIEEIENRKRDLRLRFQLARRQRVELIKAGLWKKFKTLCNCYKYAVPKFVRKNGGLVTTGSPGVVQLHHYDDLERSFAYAWVKKCESPLLCFVDAPKIRAHRAQEIQDACRRMLEAGYQFLFWTFTAPHDLETDPDFQIKQFNFAMRVFKSGRAYNDFKAKYGIEFQISAIEMTDDGPTVHKKTGVHYHQHVIVFLTREISGLESEEMYRWMSERWFECLKRVSICTDEKRRDALHNIKKNHCPCFGLDTPKHTQSIKRSLADLASYLAKGASFELAPGIFAKGGRLPEKISHWEVMALAFGGRCPELIPRALKLMSALKGRHWLHWSPGLKVFCGIAEMSDEDILKEAAGLCVHEFSKSDWEKIDSQKMQAELKQNVAEIQKTMDFDFSDPIDCQVFKDIIEEKIATIKLGFSPLTGKAIDQDQDQDFGCTTHSNVSVTQSNAP